jgi:hypothetical protein
MTHKKNKTTPHFPPSAAFKEQGAAKDCTVIRNKKFMIIPTVFVQTDLMK